MSDDRKRGESGEYVETYRTDSVLGVFEEYERPFVTSQEVADAMDCSQRTARRRLRDLDDVSGDGTLKRVDLGERQAVWWLPTGNDGDTDADSSSDE